jgi:hypothetical protein
MEVEVVQGDRVKEGKHEVRKKYRALGVGLTDREREFVKLYKEIFPEEGTEAATIRRIADVMRISAGVAEKYRWTKPRSRLECEQWKAGAVGEDGQMKEEIVSIRAVMSKLNRLYTFLEEKGNARVSDMTDILKTLAMLMSKFNTAYEDDLEQIKLITNRELLTRFTRVFGKLVGNQRAANMIMRLLKVKEDMKDEETGVDAEMDVSDSTEGVAALDGAGEMAEENESEDAEDGGASDETEPGHGTERDGTAEPGHTGDEVTIETDAKERVDQERGLIRVSPGEDVQPLRDKGDRWTVGTRGDLA